MKNLIPLLMFTLFNNITLSDSLTIQEDIEALNKKIIFLESSIEELQNTKENQISRLDYLLGKQQKKMDEFYKELDKEYRTYQIVKKQFNKDYRRQQDVIESLTQTINVNSANITKTVDELGVKIQNSNKATNQSVTNLTVTISQNTLYWITSILVVASLVLFVFILLKRQLLKQKIDLDSSLQETRKILEEEGVKLDYKLIEVFETQLKIINNSSSSTKKETNHTLALKIADEIIRIQKNLTRMDEKTKGLKQLNASVKRIQDSFTSNGYELVEMIGKPFNDGMKVSANFIPDENLEKGQQIITRIIKPQVNYKGVMIQSAQIEVSQG